MGSPIDGILGALARLLVRGPESSFILGDLEEGLRRDVERGMSPGRARLRFLLNALGSGMSLARSSRRSGRRGGIGPAWLDVKLGLRMLRRYPGLSVVSVVGMAVAIAIGAGYFTALGTLVETRLPFTEGEGVVALRHLHTSGGDRRPTARDFAAWREQLTTVEALGAFRVLGRNLILGDGRTEVIDVAAITAAGFRLPGAAPVLGRPLLPEDERGDAPDVVVIGEEEWRRVFAGDPGVIGEEVRLGDRVHTVVGVMPAGFGFPIRDRYWIPLRLEIGEEATGGPALHVFGRLADGATMEQARAELAGIGRRMATESPATHGDLRPQILPYTHAMMGVDGPEAELTIRALRLLLGVLLLIVAINVAVLVYARTATRVGEIAVRSALGASRRRIVGQLFLEAGVLTLAASALGLGLATRVLRWVHEALGRSTEARLPFWIDFGMSWGQVLYVLALAVLASVVIGVIPALKVTGKRLEALKEFAARGAGLRLGRTWTALIVIQVAVAVAVLPPALGYGGDALGVSFRPPAARADELLRARLAGAAEAGDELVRRLAAETEVSGVAFASRFPGEESDAPVEMDSAGFEAATNTVATNLFDVLGVEVIAGRGFTPADGVDGSTAVVVDQRFAERLAGAGVVGRHVRYAARGPDEEPSPWYQIVGVVRTFNEDFLPPKNFGPGGPDPRIYHPAAHANADAPVLIVRVPGGPAAFGRQVTDLATSIDPDLRLEALQTVVQKYEQDRTGFRLISIGVWAVMGSVLLLSAAGIYAMMAFTVTRRRREIGIRAALGARPTRVLAGIFGRAGAQLGAGVLAGLALTLAIEIGSPGLVLGGRGPLLLPIVIAVILTVGFLAALGPARRGLSVQPTEMLRDAS